MAFCARLPARSGHRSTQIRFITRILIAVLLSSTSLAQNYSRWWQYENRLRALTPEQLPTTNLLAQQGDVDAEMLLAAGYRTGILLPKDKKEFATWLKRAAEHGSPEAQYTLANWYSRGDELIPRDAEKNLLWTKRAADQGHPVAQYNLAVRYLQGEITPRNLPLAESWLLKSAEFGFTMAQLQLGRLYTTGKFGRTDLSAAEMWYRKAAEHGNPVALAELAKLYSNSAGAPRDPEFVEMILLRGAEMGRAEPQYELARMYRRGLLGRKDTTHAVEWFGLAAEKLYAPAAFELGQMYETSDGVNTDFQKAAELYQTAANWGYTPAIYALGELYRTGRGVALNLDAAYRWFSIGAGLGANECAAAQKRLAKEINPEQQERLTSEVQEWLNTNPEATRQKSPGKYEYHMEVWVSDDPPPLPRGPATEEEKIKAIEAAQFLETTPLGEEAVKKMKWLQQWISDVPDIFFQSCDLFEDGKNDNYRYAPALSQQISFSGAAYLVQRPEKVKDQLAIYHAGLLGALRAYEAILQQHPDAHWPLLDGLLLVRGQGGLPDFVHAKANQYCR